MTMLELTYKVSFNTPAFLGNAEQQAQWRTPPFKALLRQWWRVVKAPEVGYDHRELLRLENALFGSAGGDDGGGRSKVQLRLSEWSAGTLSQRPGLQRLDHPETKTRDGRLIRPDADVYLGFGPITTDGMRQAITPGQANVDFKIRFPAVEEDALRKAMQLIAWFGTLGSRARNGWGSLHVEQVEGDVLLGYEGLCDSKLADHAALRSLKDSLGDADWPHAVGACADGRPAVWRLVKDRDASAGKYLGFKDWREVLEQLAQLKINFRTQFKLSSGQPHNRVEDRHILAYPVTNHSLAGLPNARLANQLRFKVVKNKDGQYFGLIAHLPCAMPQAFFKGGNIRQPEITEQVRVWQWVHGFLNEHPTTSLARIRQG